ncbi:MAG: GNAT family N-acetyltransferase, partial [Lentisphaeria bacterium]|nr:GNAT family N-acetyltransferase [Lentisphaeria bacterium]
MSHKIITYQTSRLQLRPIVDSDITFVFEGLSNPTVTKHYGVHFDTLAATREQMDWFKNLENTNMGIWWAICDLTTGVFLGTGGFCDFNEADQSAEIGL